MNIDNWLIQHNGDYWFKETEVSCGTKAANLENRHRIKEILFVEQSKYQHVMVLDSYAFGKMLVLDGAVQTTEKDGFIYNEMITHVPLSIHPSAKKVLIIGGGDCGTVREVTKYKNIEQIDMVELDELTVQVSQTYFPEISSDLSDPRIRLFFTDGNEYLSQYKNHYDVIIVDSSDPVGPAQVLYEKPFYQKIYDALTTDGLMVSLGQSIFFYQEMIQSNHQKIGDIFPIVKMFTTIIPSYPGALYNFNLGSKKYHEIYLSSFDKNTKYVNHAILHSCFHLPRFMNEILNE